VTPPVATELLSFQESLFADLRRAGEGVISGCAEGAELTPEDAALEKIFVEGADEEKKHRLLCSLENLYRQGFPVEQQLGPVGAALLHRRITGSWPVKRLARHYASALLASALLLKGKNSNKSGDDEADTVAAGMEALHSAWMKLGHGARLALSHGAAKHADIAEFSEAITGVIGRGAAAACLQMLAYHQRMKLISPVCRQFRFMYMDRSIQVTVTSPVIIPHELRGELEKGIKAKLEKRYPKKELRFRYPRPAVECEPWMRDCIERHLLRQYVESLCKPETEQAH